MPGRGVGVWPEAALIGEWRDGGRRLQGDVGFGEGWPRWARFLRQREARALGGRRAATVRAEERVSRSQTGLSSEMCPGLGTAPQPWPGRAQIHWRPSAWPVDPPEWSPSCPPFYTAPQYSKGPSYIPSLLGLPPCSVFASFVSLACTPLASHYPDAW